MLRLKNLSNKFQKRLIRPLYAQTQATPYAATLDASLRNSDGSFRLPLSADTAVGGFPFDRTADAYSLKNGLVPGTVMVKSAEGEQVAVGDDVADAKPFGLLANFVGGDLDDLGDEDYVGVWRGPDSVYEILAPAFDDTGLAAAYAAATAGAPVELFIGADGRLAEAGQVSNSNVVVAELIERVSASRIVIDLKV
jgi:hypothetical protein